MNGKPKKLKKPRTDDVETLMHVAAIGGAYSFLKIVVRKDFVALFKRHSERFVAVFQAIEALELATIRKRKKT